jgi:predicted nuclease of predicted toxin-antitoxin system
MTFWLAAQLPPAPAAWLAQRFSVEALALRNLGLRDAADATIFEAARRAGVVLISNDSDFVELVSRFGPPPQLLWLTCGNVTNRCLQALFGQMFGEAMSLFAAGQAMVELS